MPPFHSMPIIAAAPHRVSFFGGGTDLPDFYRQEGGAVLSLAIDKYVYVTLKNYGSFFNEKIRLNYSITELVDAVASIDNNIIRETAQYFGVEPPFYISTIADIPSGSGLGSSSSFAVAMASAFQLYQGLAPLGKLEAAALASMIEIDKVGSPIGKQDHYAAACGGLNYIHFHKDDTVEVQPIALTPERAQTFYSHLRLYYMGGARSANAILSAQKKAIGKRKEELIFMRESAKQARDLLQSPSFEIESFGRALHEAWETKKKLTKTISNATVDAAYAAARAAGAYGGKLCGAGGTGFLLVCAPPRQHALIEKNLSALGLRPMPFTPDKDGVRTMIPFTATTGKGKE